MYPKKNTLLVREIFERSGLKNFLGANMDNSESLQLENAIVSVYNKLNLIEFLKRVSKAIPELQIFSTGGTLNLISSNWKDLFFTNPVISIEHYIDFPDLPDGLVKTLHPKIFFGLLGSPNKLEHIQVMQKYNFKFFQLLISNFYPFWELEGKTKVSTAELTHYWDIGGPSMVMAAIKGGHTIVLLEPEQYSRFLTGLSPDGKIPLRLIEEINKESLRKTVRYQMSIADYLIQ